MARFPHGSPTASRLTANLQVGVGSKSSTSEPDERPGRAASRAFAHPVAGDGPRAARPRARDQIADDEPALPACGRPDRIAQ